MNFFEHQDIARRNTRRLVILLTLAVLSLIAITTALFALAMFYVDMNSQGVNAGQTGEGFWSRLVDLVGWQALGTIALVVLVAVALGSLFKFIQLRGGGKAVAESLGGKLINGASTDANQRKLLNVVEEMAIASGTPVPPVYLLDEAGINAFAAGHSPQDAVIGITRGAIEQLDRDQLQGVIAHEFSHILHGDMRLNIRLVAILNGILVIGLLGHMLLRGSYYRSIGRSSRNNSQMAFMAVGLGLIVIGYTGTFFGNWIKAAVSRQREFLADASAVQFTRNPDGIAGALKRIASYPQGSKLQASDAAEFSHMYFGQAMSSAFSRLMATHPPLEERIKRIEPHWDATKEREAVQAQTETPEAAGAASGFQSEDLPAGSIIAASLAAIGQARPQHLERARELLNELGSRLREAAQEPSSARALVFGLLLASDSDIQKQQWEALQQRLDQRDLQALRPLIESAQQVKAHSRLPLLELALPALKQLSEPQYRQFKTLVDQLIAADGRISLMEWALTQILRHNLEPSEGVQSALKLRFCQSECQLLLSITAHAGARDQATAQSAFDAARAQLPLTELSLVARDQIKLPQLERALERLRRLKPLEKPAVLKALAAAITCDRQITALEAELFRALADGLDCPIPPLLAGTAEPLVNRH